MKRSVTLQNIQSGIKNLLLHKLRSCLTVLGVIFGVGSVVAMLAVGEGASKKALEDIHKLGSNNIIINSIKPVEDEIRSTVRTSMSIYGLLYDDELRVSASYASVKRTAPAKILRREGRLGTRLLELRIVGTTPIWFKLVRRPVIAGRILTHWDMMTHSNSVVLTEHGARRLLATKNTIGQSVRIGGNYFEVVGIVRSEPGQGSTAQTPDQEIDAYIPISTARERFGDIVTRRASGSFLRERVELHQIIIEINTLENVEPTARAIESMLEKFHKKKDYRLEIPLSLLRTAEATKRRFNIVLGSIAGISLLVGGIGIMNIMLASVTERTREIGIRRAIGAKRKQIISQFLIEAIVLSTLGGLIGVGVGLLIPCLITHFAKMPTIVTTYSLILSLGISMTVGIIFGIYPAMRAANLDPIVALRQE